eukprot:IDg14611t1
MFLSLLEWKIDSFPLSREQALLYAPPLTLESGVAFCNSDSEQNSAPAEHTAS